MTKPARDANPRWPGFLLAALVAVLVTLFGAGTASAAAATAAQTRVGAHTLIAHVLVGPQRGIGAGQRLGNDLPAYDFALATGVAAKTVEAGSDVVRYDAKFASRNLLKQTGDGYAVTPGGRTVSAHAADRIVNGAPGRGPSSLNSVDDFLDSATRSSYNPFRDTVKVQGSGRSYVVVSGTGAPHIVTVMIP